MLSYFKYSSSSKFSNYMVAGLPVLVNEKAEYPAELVGKYDVGIVYEDEKEIPQVVESVSKEEYELLRQNAIKLGEKIRKGYFFKTALRESLKKLVF